MMVREMILLRTDVGNLSARPFSEQNGWNYILTIELILN